MKQTALDWYWDKIKSHFEHDGDLLETASFTFAIAKEKEKQQSITDYCEGFKASGEGWNGEYGLDNILDVAGEIDAEQYYNETYKGGEQ